jgi:hypothetical protein
MAQWIAIKLAWLLKVLSNDMVSIMRILLVMLSKQLLFMWFCLLLFLEGVIFDS